MIELNEKTQQDFLNREWVQKLLDAGVDMSDAKYALYRLKDATSDIVVYQGTYFADDRYYNGIKVENTVPIVPTYTVSELLYKLHEWMFPNKEEENPIELFARLLIQYHKGEIGISKNVTGYSCGT